MGVPFAEVLDEVDEDAVFLEIAPGGNEDLGSAPFNHSPRARRDKSAVKPSRTGQMVSIPGPSIRPARRFDDKPWVSWLNLPTPYFNIQVMRGNPKTRWGQPGVD